MISLWSLLISTFPWRQTEPNLTWSSKMNHTVSVNSYFQQAWLLVFHFSKLLLERPNEVCAVNGTAIAEYCRDDLGCVAIPSKCLNSVFDQPVHWVTVRTFWEISVRAVLGIHIAIGLANCANERIFWQDVGIAPCDTKHVSLLNVGFHPSFIKANIRMIRLVKSSSTHPGHKCSMP